MIIIVEPGSLALLQDRGRPGLAHLGVSPSGAADQGSADLANRLVGNETSAAVIEALLGGLTIETTTLAWIAITGAPTRLEVNQTPTASHTTIMLQPGDRLRVLPPETGLRCYLAVRGGFCTAPVLGSRSTDTLAGLGPPPLMTGDRLAVGPATGQLPAADRAAAALGPPLLAIQPGPRRDWFTDQSWISLLHNDWEVSPALDRVAVRLSGDSPLARSNRGELPSEGLVRGAIQVPADGQPLIFLADHPVTGGYPVIAVLDDRSIDRAAQLRPGDTVRFTGGHRPGRTG